MGEWADLPDELLNNIVSKLFGKNRQSFGLVCRHWKTIAESAPCCHSPCLINYCGRDRTWKLYQLDSFFRVSSPRLKKQHIYCSRYDWLLMSRYNNKTKLFFFNPSNNRKIKLPLKGYEDCASLWFFNPPTSPECVVVGIGTPLDKGDTGVRTLKRGKDEWKIWKHTDKANGIRFWGSLGTPAFHRGLIYFLSWRGHLVTLDIQLERLEANCFRFRLGKRYVIEPYLVEVDGEDAALYAVLVRRWSEKKVNVLRLSSSKMKWDLVESIGDNVFYLGHNSSFGCKAPTERLKNTICFPMVRGDVAVFYSLSDAKYHSLDGGYVSYSDYGLERLDHAAWIMAMPMRTKN